MGKHTKVDVLIVEDDPRVKPLDCTTFRKAVSRLDIP